MVDIPDTIMEYVSAHGGLTHVMQMGTVTLDGVWNLIGNSPHLLKCHICAYRIHTHDVVSADALRLQEFNLTLRKKFYNRKLFSGGSHYFASKYYDYFLTMYDTELISLWPHAHIHGIKNCVVTLPGH